MEERFIVTVGQGEEQIKYLIAQIIRLDGQNFFAIIGLNDGNLMFGQYAGELPEDDEEAREMVWKDFQNGCSHIEYPDGYIVDDLYEMIEPLF